MEVTISEAIFMIATIVAASIFVGAALSQLYSFQNTFKEISSQNQNLYGSSVIVIGETEESSPNRIIVWVKNTGQTSFTLAGGGMNASYWDVFITFPNGTYQRFNYEASCSYNCWNAQVLNSIGTVGVWGEGETLQITVNTNTVPAGSYDVRLTLPNGVSTEDNFSLAGL